MQAAQKQPHARLAWPRCRAHRQRRSLLGRACADATASESAHTRPSRVLVLGGGFGGLYAALRLDALPWPRGAEPQVTLVDREPRFLFKPLMYELLMGELTTDEVAPPFSTLLTGTRVNFVQDAATAVQPDCTLQGPRGGGVLGSVGGGTVTLGSGQTLPYDWLVLALGATSSVDIVPGARGHAIPFLTLEDVQRAEKALKQARGAGRVRIAVIGAALAGVELAAAVAGVLGDSGGEVLLLASGADIMPENTDGQRAAARAALTRARVEVVPFRRVASISGAADEGASPRQRKVCFRTSDGTAPPPPLDVDLVLWTAGQRPVGAQLLGPGWLNDAIGRISTDATLRVRGHERMFALGDAAAVPAGSSMGSSPASSYSATAQVAFQQADYCAWNVYASMQGRPLLPFRYQHLGEMLSLGPKDASVNLPLGDISLEGPLAALLRKAAYVYRQPTMESRLRVGTMMLQIASDQRLRQRPVKRWM